MGQTNSREKRMTVKHNALHLSPHKKRVLPAILTVAFIAFLAVGLEGCKTFQFVKSLRSDQATTETTETPEKVETTRSAEMANADGEIVALQAFNLCTDCLLTSVRGQAVHRAPDSVKGALESIIVFGDKVQFKGWAADTGTTGQTLTVLIFADDKLTHMGPLTEERFDVAQALGTVSGVHSGFSVILPKALFSRGDGKNDAALRLFAITQSGMAAELPFKKSN